MARIDADAAKQERQKAATFAAEAKQLRQVANHLDEEALEHSKEANALIGSSARRGEDPLTEGTSQQAGGKSSRRS